MWNFLKGWRMTKWPMSPSAVLLQKHILFLYDWIFTRWLWVKSGVWANVAFGQSSLILKTKQRGAVEAHALLTSFHKPLHGDGSGNMKSQTPHRSELRWSVMGLERSRPRKERMLVFQRADMQTFLPNGLLATRNPEQVKRQQQNTPRWVPQEVI